MNSGTRYVFFVSVVSLLVLDKGAYKGLSHDARKPACALLRGLPHREVGWLPDLCLFILVIIC